jgi:leucyl aminopeptidase
MKVSFSKFVLPKEGALVLGIFEDRGLSDGGKQLDQSSGGTLTRALRNSRFSGKKEQSLLINSPGGVSLSRILLIGLGKIDKFTALTAEMFGGAAFSHLQKSGDSTALLLIDSDEDLPLSLSDCAAHAGLAAKLRAYRFDKYRTKEKADDKPSLKKIILAVPEPSEAKKAFEPLNAISEAVYFTRDLVSEPGNIIYPETLSKEAQSLHDLGVKLDHFGEKQMRKMGMGALLGVGQGSDKESRMVIMRWMGGDEGQAPVAIVGKGVTFDTGGISLKPATNMEDMKYDMGGAAVVIGLMKALALRKAKVNVVGVVGLVENMPSGSAQRPGDVVTSMSGQTIEVINTDAEGRLVLADALWYAQERFKPKVVIDLATLTGAIVISLGVHYAGLFSNDDKLSDHLMKAGATVGEKLWRLPVDEAYDKQIKSDIADMQNVGGREAGSITAAMFLKRFIKEDVKWAHLDIAGVTWADKDSAITPKGATAFGVRLLDRYLSDSFEKE